MYKVAIASFLQETNTFSPYKTTESDFTFAEGNIFYSNLIFSNFLQVNKNSFLNIKVFHDSILYKIINFKV